MTYVRDRLLVARELLAPTGSIFVQIGDENAHHVREALDEVFGPDHFCGVITVRKTSAPTDLLVPTIADFILWYGRDRERIKYRQLYLEKVVGEEGGTIYSWAELPDGSERKLTAEGSRGRLPFR